MVQDIIDEVCAKLGVVSQMEQDEYTIFAMVETGESVLASYHQPSYHQPLYHRVLTTGLLMNYPGKLFV